MSIRLVPPMGYGLASRMVAKENRKVKFMYREEPDNEQDSGWRFFCGEEDQDYSDNPDNIGLYDVNTIAEIDPSIIPFLHKHPPCAFERDNENQAFEPATDYEFEAEEYLRLYGFGKKKF